QPSEALKKREDRQWDLIFTKRVAAGSVDRFDPRGRDRIARGRERQLVDDHAAQSLADDVDALPEAGGREQDGVGRGLELAQQRRTRRRALNEDRIGNARRGELMDLAEIRVAR